MEEAVQITTTADNRETIEKIGRSLVEKRLASCAQVLGPIKSIYRWKGKIEETEEWLCLIKSRKSLSKDVEAEILRLHPYELPEITVTIIDGGLAGYIQWVVDETSA
jgi:periplasmic divalent cation tolerance protein